MKHVNSDENLVVNGNFDSGTAGWFFSPNAWNAGGYAMLSNATYISQDIAITGGETYAFSFDMEMYYDGSGDVTVTSMPSGTQLFKDTSTGDQKNISLTVTELSDTSLTMLFECTRGGEVHVDNVTLVKSEKAFVVGGDFSDPAMPGWMKTGNNTNGDMPSDNAGFLSLPAGTSVTQDIVIGEARALNLAYSMTIPDGAEATFSVVSLPSSTSVYSNSASHSGKAEFFSLSEGDNIARLKFSCKSGTGVEADDVVLKYTSLVNTVTITEKMADDGNLPVINVGYAGDISFTLNTGGQPDDTGAAITFTAPDNTTINSITFPGITGPCNQAVATDGKTATATLTGNNILWGDTIVMNISVDSDAQPFITLSDGTITYTSSDGYSLNTSYIQLVTDRVCLVKNVTITEQMADDGNLPVIKLGYTGEITFALDTGGQPDDTGAVIAFTAPDDTTISSISFPKISGYDWQQAVATDGKTATATLTGNNILWGDAIVMNISVDSDAQPFVTLGNGSITYTSSDEDTLTSSNIQLATDRVSPVTSVSVTEVMDKNGNPPAIKLGEAMDISFTLDTEGQPDDTGATLAFTAPAGTIINRITFPDINGIYEKTVATDGKTATAVLTENNVQWGSTFTLNITVNSDADMFTTVSNGTVTYTNGDGASCGYASVAVIPVSDNPWDNVLGISKVKLWAESSSSSDGSVANLFINGNHQVKVTFGLTLTPKMAAYPVPATGDVSKALTLIDNTNGAGLKYLDSSTTAGSYTVVYDPALGEAIMGLQDGNYQSEIVHYFSSNTSKNPNAASEDVSAKLVYTLTSGAQIINDFSEASSDGSSKTFVSVKCYPSKKYTIDDLKLSNHEIAPSTSVHYGDGATGYDTYLYRLTMTNGYYRFSSCVTAGGVKDDPDCLGYDGDSTSAIMWDTISDLYIPTNSVGIGAKDVSYTAMIHTPDGTLCSATIDFTQYDNELVLLSTDITFNYNFDNAAVMNSTVNCMDQFGNKFTFKLTDSGGSHVVPVIQSVS